MNFLRSCLVLAFLSGCQQPISALGGTTVGVGWLALDGFSMINTSKTVEDHIVSNYKDMDCSSLRAAQGGAYCKPWKQPYVSLPPKKSYCYRTLADITCYSSPIPGEDTAEGNDTQ